jgi:hypothetical protein
VGDGVVSHTDRQIQDYLLCRDCEHILNERGENWVNSKLATTEKTFPLYDLVMSSPEAFSDENGGVYLTADNPDFDVKSLSHFALGIFWKAGVHSWSGARTEPMIDLGDYTEPIRTWLKGETAFPRDVTLTIMCSRPENTFVVLSQPVEVKGKAWRNYWFYVPGVMFFLNIGPTIELEMRTCCFYHMPAHPVFISDDIIKKFHERLGKDYMDSRKAKGYLKQKGTRQKP